MPRTTSQAVHDILDRNYDEETQPDLSPFIGTASIVVDRVVAMAAGKVFSVSLSNSELEMLERWLAAHFYCVNDPLYTSRSTQGASGQFQTSPPSEGFGATEYGRQAIAMDYSGSLKQLSSKSRASAFWLGKPPSGQIDYKDRD